MSDKENDKPPSSFPRKRQITHMSDLAKSVLDLMKKPSLHQPSTEQDEPEFPPEKPRP